MNHRHKRSPQIDGCEAVFGGCYGSDYPPRAMRSGVLAFAADVAALAGRFGKHGIAYRVLEVQADEASVKERLLGRETKSDEVSDARLDDFEMLTGLYEPPTELPANCLVTVRTRSFAEETAIAALRGLAAAQVRTYDSGKE